MDIDKLQGEQTSADIAIRNLETVDLEVLKDVWRNLNSDRKQALKKKLMALAFI